jgi:alpha 1,2-mannosyltransferase
MDFWRGEAYQRFFNFLDSKGGFYYEVNGPPACSISIISFEDDHSDGETRLSIV